MLLLRNRGRPAQFRTIPVDPGDSFSVGRTPIAVRVTQADADTTLILRPEPRRLSLRVSTRELLDSDSEVVARFSTAEAAAFVILAERHPDAADHAAIGHAVWGDYPYDQYQIHRLLQRIRLRLPARDLIENVRGAGYRLTEPIDLK